MKKRKNDPLEEIMSNPYYQLRDDYNYAEKVKGTISFGQYSMKYWALERDIVLDKVQKSSQGTDGANRSSTEIIFWSLWGMTKARRKKY